MTDDERFGAFSLEELSDYLDADRTPARPDIDADPEASVALARLEVLRTASRDLLDADVAATAVDDGWIASVLASVRTTAHAGRDIPVPDEDPASTLVVTEGALRGLVRALGDEVPGVVVRRTRFTGELGTAGAPIDVEVSIAASTDGPVHLRAEALRTRIADTLAVHAPFVVRSLVVHVADINDGDRS
ncbi:hypothetical protein ACQXVK_15010 [Curtobacterium sp. AB451]|uniref:hypothetical protein n=1 Tax=Curtobacterium sp. AB451 TaxID=3422306 RepID=UPI003D32C414